VWRMPQNINSYWCQKIRTFYNCEMQEWQHMKLNAIKCLSSCHKKTFNIYESFSWFERGNDVSRYEEWIFLQLNQGVSLPKWSLKFSTCGKAIKTTRTPWWQTKRLGHLSILNLCLKLTVPMAKGKRAFNTWNFK
jgi:hypothetical protein